MIEKTELEINIDNLLKRKEDRRIINRNLLNMRLEIYTLNRETKKPERISLLKELIIKVIYYFGYISFTSLTGIFQSVCDEEELEKILKELSFLDEDKKIEGEDLRKKILKKNELEVLKNVFEGKNANDISITEDELKIMKKAIEEINKKEENANKKVKRKDYILHKEKNRFLGDIYMLSSKTLKDIEKTEYSKMYDIPGTIEALAVNKLRGDYFTERVMEASLIELERIWDALLEDKKKFCLNKNFIKYISGDEFFKKDKEKRKEILKGLGRNKGVPSLIKATNIDEDIRERYFEIIMKALKEKNYILRLDKLNSFMKNAKSTEDKRIKYYLLHDLIKDTNSKKKFLSIIQNTLFGEFSNLLYCNNIELRDKIAKLCNDVIRENNLEKCDYPETFTIHNKIERLQSKKAICADIGKTKRNRKIKIHELYKEGKYAKKEADELDAINKDLEIINKTIEGLNIDIKKEQDKVCFHNPKKSINNKEKKEGKNPCITFETMISNKIYVENAYVKNKKLVIDLVGFDASGNYNSDIAMKKIFGTTEMLKGIIDKSSQNETEGSIGYIIVNYKLVYINYSSSTKYEVIYKNIIDSYETLRDSFSEGASMPRPDIFKPIMIEDFLTKSEYIHKII